MYLVNIFGTDHFVNAKGNTIWNKIWTRRFDTKAEADAFIDYHKTEFGRTATLHKQGDGKWVLVSDTRY